jgi:hypothetical protein
LCVCLANSSMSATPYSEAPALNTSLNMTQTHTHEASMKHKR